MMNLDRQPGIGGIVLCGGKSTRMGRSKWSLPFGRETLLQRSVRILSQVVEPIVVVAADGQSISGLGEHVMLARDQFPEKGPLAGIHAGMELLADTKAEAAYVTACDVPLLKPGFVRAIVRQLGNHELVVAREGRFHHPLAGVYRLSLRERVRRLLEGDQLRPLFLIEQSDRLEIDVEQLREWDPELDSLRNCNTPEDYEMALTLAGLGRDCSGEP